MFFCGIFSSCSKCTRSNHPFEWELEAAARINRKENRKERKSGGIIALHCKQLRFLRLCRFDWNWAVKLFSLNSCASQAAIFIRLEKIRPISSSKSALFELMKLREEQKWKLREWKLLWFKRHADHQLTVEVSISLNRLSFFLQICCG